MHWLYAAEGRRADSSGATFFNLLQGVFAGNQDWANDGKGIGSRRPDVAQGDARAQGFESNYVGVCEMKAVAETQLVPGKYWVWLNGKAKAAELFEDLDAGCMAIRFEGVDRCQRFDELDEDCTFTVRDEETARAVARKR